MTTSELESDLTLVKKMKRIKAWERELGPNHPTWKVTTLSGNTIRLHSTRELAIFLTGVLWSKQ